jgi:glycosyltransferase involved in cell wall biosynthesis
MELPADHVIFISVIQGLAWHLDLDDPRVHVIGDGIDADLLGQALPPRDPNRLIWASNPDRGLPIAAHIFQEIRKRWPDFELHIFGRSSVYGWDPNVEAPYIPRQCDRENVFLHDPLPRSQLMQELARSWAFFYPTWWPETYCMAALEAQAAGTPVIASPVGALSETVKGGVLTFDFLNAVSQLRNQRRWTKLSCAGIEWASMNTWDSVAARWIEACHD